MSTIIGIASGYHDAAAALVIDGSLVAAAEQERFSRIKHDPALPLDVLTWLSAEHLGGRPVDHVVFYERPLAKLDRAQSMRRGRLGGHRHFHRNTKAWIAEHLWIEADIHGALEAAGIGFAGKVVFADHHLSHAASAFYPSPFERAAVICLDGVGEWASASLSSGEGSRLERLGLGLFPHSVGLFYATMTQLAGFKVNSGEYKLMGLAPYGEPRLVDRLLGTVIDVDNDGGVRLDLRYFGFLNGETMTSPRLVELLGAGEAVVDHDGVPTALACDLAASAQMICDLVVERSIRYGVAQTGVRQVALAGGVALNCVANGRALENGACDELFIQPAASDAGGAAGAALALSAQLGELDRHWVRDGADAMQSGFLGREIHAAESDALVARIGVVSRVLDREAADAEIARLIADGKTVAICRGRAEYGPRALGNRSILADARSVTTQRELNLAVKQRESFRPFAPMVLADQAADWFDYPYGDPYMTTVASLVAGRRRNTDRMVNVIDEVNQVRSEVPAITHVDYTARVQLVGPGHPMEAVLRHFQRLTGVPMVVNTSFNRRGEPIVNTAEDAYRCFWHSGIDMLVLGDHIISRSDQKHGPVDDIVREPD